MIRIKTNNIIIALGLVFFYTGVASTAPELKQAFSHSPGKTLQAEAEVEVYFSVPLKEQIGGAAPLVIFRPEPANADPLLAENLSKPEKPSTVSRSWFSGEELVERAVPESPVFEPEVPVRLSIPAIELDAPVIQAESRVVRVNGIEYQQWQAPSKYAAGWHGGSAKLGQPGNTVFNGHHNVYGEVFVRLVELNIGDTISVYSTQHVYEYMITNKMILPEKYEDLDVRMNNAQWIMTSQDERLTLITCWPYESNTHRLIIVAKPILREKLDRNHE